MNRRFLKAVGLLAIIGGLVVLGLRWYIRRPEGAPPPSDEQVAEVLRRKFRDAQVEPTILPSVSIPANYAVHLAIGGLGLPDDARNGQLADLLTAELTGVKGLELVERPALDKVLRELELNRSGLVRARDAVRVCKLVRAEWFLMGSGVAVGGHDSVVLRLVDARNGVIRDVTVLNSPPDVSVMAAEAGRFIRRSREAGTDAKSRIFLAVGSLVDVGINRRQEAFPDQLRAWLTRAYQGSPITLLEREQVSALLQEVRLDLAGLTEDAANAAPTPMQSAFWLVDGFFQSFETSGYDVELVLRVNRVFGRTTTTTLRGAPGEPLFNDVKRAIDTTLARAGGATAIPTRRSEAHQQLSLGKELYQAGVGLDPSAILSPGYAVLGTGEQNSAKRAHYLNEAVRALETVLLLEPENGEAKLYLSACYRDRGLARYDEGVALLRELAGQPQESEWSEKARPALGRFFMNSDPGQASRWFTEAANHSKDPQAASTYRRLAQEASSDAAAQTARQSGARPDETAGAPLEARLFERIQSAQDVLQGKAGTISDLYGLDEFVSAFGDDHQAAARRIAELLPKLKQLFPEMVPHLLGAAVVCLVETNSPLIVEFRALLIDSGEHPERVLRCDQYFVVLINSTYRWCLEKKFYALAAEILEAKREAAARSVGLKFDDRDKVRLGFAYQALQRWQEALALFEPFGDAAINMRADGPWGKVFDLYFPAKSAALCREKLGLTQVQVNDRFDFGRPCLCLHTPSTFAVFDSGLWIAIGGTLLQLDFDLKTNKQIALPIPQTTPLTALCLRTDRLWVGTDGSGLVEYDKTTGNCRQFTEKDGLLISSVSSLCLEGSTLWLGFARGREGGLGRRDLITGRFSAFTPALSSDPLDSKPVPLTEGPPRQPVIALTVAPNGDLWLLESGTGLRCYRKSKGSWTGFQEHDGVRVQCFTFCGGKLMAGFSLAQQKMLLADVQAPGASNPPGIIERVVTLEEAPRLRQDPALQRRIRGFELGTEPDLGDLRVCDLGTGQWERVSENVELPAPPDVITFDGRGVWLGGSGYVAIVDLGEKKIRKMARISAQSVDRIEIANGFVWAQFGRHLYRVPLNAAL